MFCCALLYVHSRIAILLMGEYDHVVPQSQTIHKPVAPQERAIQQTRDNRKTNKAKQPALSSPSR